MWKAIKRKDFNKFTFWKIIYLNRTRPQKDIISRHNNLSFSVLPSKNKTLLFGLRLHKISWTVPVPVMKKSSGYYAIKNTNYITFMSIPISRY